MKRVALFLVTNIAILVILSVTLSLLGVDALFASHPPLDEHIADLRQGGA